MSKIDFKKENLVKVNETLDRNKILDEAIFLALCGRDQCKDGLYITGVVRLEIAYHKLGLVIEKINKDL